jgi:hypothetical protein
VTLILASYMGSIMTLILLFRYFFELMPISSVEAKLADVLTISALVLTFDSRLEKVIL